MGKSRFLRSILFAWLLSVLATHALTAPLSCEDIFFDKVSGSVSSTRQIGREFQTEGGASAHLQLKKDRLGNTALEIVTPSTVVNLGPLSRLAAGDVTFHWAGGYADDLAKRGHITDELIDQFLTEQRAKEHYHGRGFYVSRDPFDASSYGSQLFTVTAHRPLLLVPNEIIRELRRLKLIPQNFTDLHQLLRELGVHGQDLGGWIIFFRADALDDVRVLGSSEVVDLYQKTLPQKKDSLEVIKGYTVLAEKGLVPSVPNEYTKKIAPAWDKLLRGQKLSAFEVSAIFNELLNKYPLDVKTPEYDPYYVMSGLLGFEFREFFFGRKANLDLREASAVYGPTIQNLIQFFRAQIAALPNASDSAQRYQALLNTPREQRVTPTGLSSDDKIYIYSITILNDLEGI